jgi:hypothetical protein
LLLNHILNKDRRASLISSCSKTITQYKFDLMILNINIIQNIRRGHEQLLIDLQEKLSKASCTQSMTQAIRNRHEIYLKHKLNIFFDEAPTVLSE